MLLSNWRHSHPSIGCPRRSSVPTAYAVRAAYPAVMKRARQFGLPRHPTRRARELPGCQFFSPRPSASPSSHRWKVLRLFASHPRVPARRRRPTIHVRIHRLRRRSRSVSHAECPSVPPPLTHSLADPSLAVSHHHGRPGVVRHQAGVRRGRVRRLHRHGLQLRYGASQGVPPGRACQTSLATAEDVILLNKRACKVRVVDRASNIFQRMTQGVGEFCMSSA